MGAAEDTAEVLLDRFCEAWERGSPLSISETLAALGPDAPQARSLLLELIKVDVEQQWQLWSRLFRRVGASADEATASHPPPLDSYLREFNEIEAEPGPLRELLIHEYRVRQRWGDRPEIDEYIHHFRNMKVAERLELRAELAAESSILALFTDSSEDPSSSRTSTPLTMSADQESLRRVLSHVTPFSELPSEVRDALAMHATVRPFEAGELLLRQGETADSLLVILEGSVEVKVSDGDRSHLIARLEQHTIVGEMGLLTGERRSANVAAVQPGRVAVIARDKLEHIAGCHPRLGVALSELIADRIGTRTIDALYGKAVGNYRIGHRLGRGGMGIVYAATQVAPTRGRQVALKMLRHDLVCDRSSAARFRQEAEIVQSLCHPHIVRMFEEFPAYGTRFIALELCPGISLSEMIERGGRLPEPVVRSVVGQLAGALDCAHTAGIAHRDLKPSNVLVRRDGIVKLTDFGLARAPVGKGGDQSLTESRQIVGTPHYMAPEQFLGERGDSRSDLYSLGVLAYEMLTGGPQLRTNRISDLARERLSWSLPAAELVRSGLDQGLYEFLASCLTQEPEHRRVPLTEFFSWGCPIDWREVSAAVWPGDAHQLPSPALTGNPVR